MHPNYKKNLIARKKVIKYKCEYKSRDYAKHKLSHSLTHFIPWNVVSIRDESVQVIKESGFEFMFAKKHALLP